MRLPVHGCTAVLQHVALNAAQNLKALPSIQISMTHASGNTYSLRLTLGFSSSVNPHGLCSSTAAIHSLCSSAEAKF